MIPLSAQHPPDETQTAAADGFLAAALRGEMPLPPMPSAAILVARAQYHGVAALLVSRPRIMQHLPQETGAALKQQALAETMWDLRHRQLLLPLLEALAQADVHPLVLKGTALAYGHYPSASLPLCVLEEIRIFWLHRRKARLFTSVSEHKVSYAISIATQVCRHLLSGRKHGRASCPMEVVIP